MLLFLEKIFKAVHEFLLGRPGGGTVELVRTLHSPDGRHRVCFFHRIEDDIYGYREEVYDTRGLEPVWIPMHHGHVQEHPSLQTALSRARAEIHWLSLVE